MPNTPCITQCGYLANPENLDWLGLTSPCTRLEDLSSPINRTKITSPHGAVLVNIYIGLLAFLSTTHVALSLDAHIRSLFCPGLGKFTNTGQKLPALCLRTRRRQLNLMTDLENTLQPFYTLLKLTRSSFQEPS